MSLHLIAISSADGLAPLLGAPPPYPFGDIAISFNGPSIGFIANGTLGLDTFADFNASPPPGLTFAEFFGSGQAVYAPSAAATPEAATWIMVALGLAMIAGVRQRRKTARALT